MESRTTNPSSARIRAPAVRGLTRMLQGVYVKEHPSGQKLILTSDSSPVAGLYLLMQSSQTPCS